MHSSSAGLHAQDASLRHTLQFGIGLHHAGLTDTDRKVAEALFVAGKIQVRGAAFIINVPSISELPCKFGTACITCSFLRRISSTTGWSPNLVGIKQHSRASELLWEDERVKFRSDVVAQVLIAKNAPDNVLSCLDTHLIAA